MNSKRREPVTILHPSKTRTIECLSVVIPFYNEKDSVRPVLDELHEVVAKQRFDFEIIAVDDGSNDGTWDELLAVKKNIPEMRAVKLKSNSGQTRAMAAGISVACGDWIMTMDGDGQNDPRPLPRLLDKARDGYDVVSGWRYKRKDGALRRKLSRVANRLLAAITGLMLHDSGCSLKLYRAKALRSISLYSDRHRFLPFLLHMRGFYVAEIKVDHRPRTRGKSKYGFSRVGKVFSDLLALALFARFKEAPRIYFFILAVPFLIFSAAAAFAAFGPEARGTITLPGLSFLLAAGGFVLLSWGLLADWIIHFERRLYRGA